MFRPPASRNAAGAVEDYSAFNLIIICLGLGFFSYVSWTYFHAQISAAVIAVTHREIALLRYFTNRYDLADRQMAVADTTTVTLRDLYGISHDIGMFLRLPATVFIAVLAGLCATLCAPSKFRRRFNLDQLAAEQARSFRVTSAFAKRHLKLVAPGVPLRPADYSLTGPEWIGRFATAADGSFDEGMARQGLAAQLGEVWRGPAGAPPHVRCVFASFALHLALRREDATDLLGAISAACELGSRKNDLPEGPREPLALPKQAAASTAAVFLDPELVGPARAIAGRHAFTQTALMGLLIEARRRAGVLAPVQFAWIKLIDRNLWYALHSLGFETDSPGRYLHPNARVEAIGARAHWAVERLLGEPVRVPALECAVEALRRSVEAHNATRPFAESGSRMPSGN